MCSCKWLMGLLGPQTHFQDCYPSVWNMSSSLRYYLRWYEKCKGMPTEKDQWRFHWWVPGMKPCIPWGFQHMTPRPCYRVVGIYLYQGSDLGTCCGQGDLLQSCTHWNAKMDSTCLPCSSKGYIKQSLLCFEFETLDFIKRQHVTQGRHADGEGVNLSATTFEPWLPGLVGSCHYCVADSSCSSCWYQTWRLQDKGRVRLESGSAMFISGSTWNRQRYC